MQPSKYQAVILDWIKNGSGHGCCNAVAGSGKSSTLRMAAQELEKSGISPSEIKVIVFGKANSEDLLSKFGSAWKDSISTLHSCGFRLLQQEVGRFTRHERVKGQKYRYITRDMGYVPSKGKGGDLTRSKAIEKPEDLYKVIDLVRLTLSPGKPEDIEHLAGHFNIEGIRNASTVSHAVGQILKVGEQQAIAHEVDYTDQIWLPVKWQLHQKSWFKPYKFVLTDECLPGDSLVTLADGSQMPIQSIVERHLSVSVLSYNELKQTIEVKPVTGWRRVPRRDRQILEVEGLRATEDHPIFTREHGYISMAEAATGNVHVMVLDHEKVRSEDQANGQGAVNYHRVATWRCVDQSGDLEGKLGQCQGKVCTWAGTVGVPGMEAAGVAPLGRNVSSTGKANQDRVWRHSLSLSNFNSPSVYGNLRTDQARGQGEENYPETLAALGRPSNCSLVHGRRYHEAVGCGDSGLLLPPVGLGICLCLADSKRNRMQDKTLFKRSNHWNPGERNQSVKGTYSTLYSSLLGLQVRNNAESELCSLRSTVPSEKGNNHQTDLQLQVRDRESKADSKTDVSCQTKASGISKLLNLSKTISGQTLWSRHEEDLQSNMLLSTQMADAPDGDWVYCLDVADNHNFFADGILVHNCQDLNPAQLELAISLAGEAGRLLFVGDRRQAIMGFSGADHRSYDKILERTKATELPLSICYRCPKSHIELVRSLFPGIPIEPRDNALEGAISQITEKDLDQHLKTGDRVISRKTAPLVTLCIKLISKGVAATVKGRDIGEAIKRDLEEIASMPGFRYNKFNEAADAYRKIKLAKYDGLDNEEQMTEALNDKLEALSAIYRSQSNAKSIEELGIYIDSLFSDEISPVTLSTCHRAKGLEGDRIFILKPQDLPFTWRNQLPWQKEQEDNLLYVALTRSKSELFVVGEPDWLKTQSKQSQSDDLQIQTDQECEDCNDGFYIVTPEGATCNVCGCMSVFPALNTDPQFACKTCGYIHLICAEDGSTCPQCNSRDIKSDIEWHGDEIASELEPQAQLSPLAQLEQDIREYFGTAGLKEPKLTQAYEGVVKVASGTMARDEIDERLSMFFSPTHRPAVKRFAEKLCDLREADMKAQSTQEQAIETHLEAQREALGMNRDDHEFEGEVQITPVKILVKGKYRNSKIYEYSHEQGIPDWALGLPVLYYPGCTASESQEEIAPTVELETVNSLQSSAETSETPQKQWLNLGLITLDAGTQSRKGTSQQTIEDYAEQMAASRWDWERFPLPIIFSDGENFWPGDGHHRIEATGVAQLEQIFVEIRPGTLRDAIFCSTSANKYHGLPRTNADKRNQVELLLRDPEWQQMSDRAIANHCNVSAPFVGKVRAELTEFGTVNPSNERVDRKGRKLNTANIGTKPKSAPQPAVAAEAIAPTRTAAEPLLESSTVGVLEAAFRKDQEQEQARTNRATQIKTEIASLRVRLAALEAELAAL